MRPGRLGGGGGHPHLRNLCDEFAALSSCGGRGFTTTDAFAPRSTPETTHVYVRFRRQGTPIDRRHHHQRVASSDRAVGRSNLSRRSPHQAAPAYRRTICKRAPSASSNQARLEPVRVKTPKRTHRASVHRLSARFLVQFVHLTGPGHRGIDVYAAGTPVAEKSRSESR